MFIIWDDSVALGHELIDRDHQHLIAIINRLHDATLREHGPEVIGATLADLADYAHFHFEREERLMERHHYAEYADHRTRHEVLLADLTALIYRFECGDTRVTLETMDFLRDWLLNHVKGTDRKLVSFLLRWT